MRSGIVALLALMLFAGAAAAADDAPGAHTMHMLALPLVERVEAASPQLVDDLNRKIAAGDPRERLRTTQAPATFIAEVKAALAELPVEVNLLFVDRLAGVLLVDGLGDTAVTEAVEGDNGQPVAGYIVLDAGALAGRTANEWATWKESSPFAADARLELLARIERSAQDNRRQAIQYALLHELGHVLSIGNAVHPPWTIAPRDAGPADAYPFFKQSWQVDAQANKYVSLFEGAKPGPQQMVEAYAQLARTNFPSLRAAASPADDFAESFASYVHVVLMKRPWEIVIRRSGEEVMRFPACWEEERCAVKRKILEDVLKGP